MDFSTEFFWNSLWAAAFAFFYYSLPGLWTGLLLGFRANLSLLFIAPALGLCAFGPFSLLFTWLLGYSAFTVSIAWILFQVGVMLVYFKFIRRPVDSSLSPYIPQDLLSMPGTGWLLLAASLWALVPVINIYPVVFQDGLYVNIDIFDHMKISFVDGIAREGLPPLNPFYAPAGERIPLIYYYTWHFLGAQVKTLSGVSGWQTEVAMSWLTSFATIAFMSGLAVRISGRLWAGFALLLMGLATPPARILPQIMGARWEGLVRLPQGHELEVLWAQLSWAPQHVFAALCSLLLLFLITNSLRSPSLRWYYGATAGLTAAAGFGASVWVGGVALAIVMPVLLSALLLALSRMRFDYSKYGMPILLSIGVCVVFALPVLYAVTSGPKVAEGFPLALKLYKATRLFGQNTHLEVIGHIALFWLQFLPLCLGIVYVLGLLAVSAYSPRDLETRVFKYLSISAIFTYLLVVQWVQSAIMNNDFGWRSVNVPFMLLLIWAAVGLADIQHHFSRWHGKKILYRVRPILVPLIWAGITIGMLASFRTWHFPKPNPSKSPLSQELLVLHQDFFHQREAWEALRRHTDPDDLVQNNPINYATVITRWSAPAPIALFGNRPVAYGEPESVNVFAHSYDKTRKDKQHAAISALYEAHPEPAELAYARDTLRIKALLVDPRDPVWQSKAIEDSGIYRLVEATDQFKIYLAVTDENI
jgi:hypothetical protein